MTAPQSQFRADLWASTLACASAPWLLVVTVVIQVVPAALDNAAASNRSIAYLGSVGSIIELLTIGFYATQRVWLFRLYRGRELRAAEGWRLTMDYFPRFAALGALVVLPIAVVYVAVVLGIRSNAANVITVGVLFYGLDVLLTFVVPELTFHTASAREAWRTGRAMIKATWPESRWYVLAPGLAILAVTDALSGAHLTVWLAAAEAAVAALLSLVFRGAILAYYLRLRPEIVD